MVNICVIEVLEEHMAGKAFGEIMIKGDTKINSVVKLQTQEVQPTQLKRAELKTSRNGALNKSELNV